MDEDRCFLRHDRVPGVCTLMANRLLVRLENVGGNGVTVACVPLPQDKGRGRSPTMELPERRVPYGAEQGHTPQPTHRKQITVYFACENMACALI